MERLHKLVRGEVVQRVALPAWLDRLASLGIVTGDLQVARRQRFTNIVAYAVALNTASHLVTNWLLEPADLWPVHVYNAAFTMVALLIHRLHRFGPNAAANTLALLVLVGNLFVIWMLGRESQLHVYFTLAGILLFMFGVDNLREFFVWYGIAFVALLASLYLAPEHGILLTQDSTLHEVLAANAMINAIIINGLSIFYVLTVLRRTEIELENQYARSAALVEAILPPPVADRLILGAEPRIADRVENLSVLFADLVGFTRAAHDLPPEEIIDYLDDFVRTFDDLCARHCVEKIKTIGDCYMAAGGLNGFGRDGAVAIGRLGLAMLDAQARRRPLGRDRLGLRVGIHLGSATAGIIGDMRFSYDVWGDAVNVASRMESHGVPGRIHVSADFRAATRDAFLFEARGETEIRGIGRTPTFFLLRPVGRA
ncbi:MAG: adenylate/guanylate cyclase domain-containing protein [Bradyrhizobiaceae bacterium]|nr:adenylate/guanylate cyclase domain-containing protein [Bradyrhizobiaceae bacterium]